MPERYPADGAEAPTRSHVPADTGVPTESLVSGTVGDRCVNCGTPLSSDQRYCVVCGERRGAPRFTLPAATAAPATESTTVATSPRGPRYGTRLGIGAVIAGVATLLLAMLVGVLIGHNTAGNGSRTVASAPVRIIKVGGGSSSGGTSGSTSGSGSGTGGTAHTSAKTKTRTKAKSKAAANPVATKKAAAKVQSAAAKVLGGKGAPPATVTVGQTGTGKGYSKKTHKFNGSFFGQ